MAKTQPLMDDMRDLLSPPWCGEDRYTDLRFSPYGTAFLTDAIIGQRYIEIDSRLLRILGVVKVRASAHSDELREFTIDDQGIHLGETLRDQEGLLGGRPRRKATRDLEQDRTPRVSREARR